MGTLGKIRISAGLAGKLAIAGLLGAGPAVANDFNTEKVMKEMDAVQRYVFTAGVVEGLAVARYMKDGKKKDGMECIYGWFYEDKKIIYTIYAAFEKYPTYPPGAVMDVLIKRKCGE